MDSFVMNKELSRINHSALDPLTLEVTSPLLTRALFWRAHFLKESPFLHHLSFLFWLIETSRPQSYVELGVEDGVSFFATCQAAEKLNLEARCDGIGIWKDGIPQDLTKHLKENYSDFAHLAAVDPRDCVHKFPDGSIDLLHVQLAQVPEFVDHFEYDWARKLSHRAIVLFHGINNAALDRPRRLLMDRLTAAHPSLTLDVEDGLTVMLFGPEQNDRLIRLATLVPGSSGFSDLRRLFARLGASHYHEWRSRTEAAQASLERIRAEAAERQLAELREQSQALAETLESRELAHDTRSEQVAAMQARISELQDALARCLTEMADLQRRHAELEHALAAGTAEGLRRSLDTAETDFEVIRAEREALKQAQEQAEQTIAALNTRTAAQDAEIAQLRNEIEKRDRDLAEKTKSHAAALQALQQEHDAALAREAELSAKLEAMQAEHIAALAARDTSLADKQRKLESLERDVSELNAKLADRFNELAVLTRMLEERDPKAAASPRPKEKTGQPSAKTAATKTTGAGTKKPVSIAGGTEKPVRNLLDVLNRARTAFHTGDYATAANLFDSLGPDHVMGLRSAAEAYDRLGSANEAISRLKRAAELDPANAAITRRIHEISRPNWLRRLGNKTGALKERPFPIKVPG